MKAEVHADTQSGALQIGPLEQFHEGPLLHCLFENDLHVFELLLDLNITETPAAEADESSQAFFLAVLEKIPTRRLDNHMLGANLVMLSFRRERMAESLGREQGLTHLRNPPHHGQYENRNHKKQIKRDFPGVVADDIAGASADEGSDKSS